MEAFTDFLAANYFWFLVISIFLVFALIGYLVDQQEQKKGISLINKPKEEEVNIEDLAAMAQNKSMNEAVSDAVKNHSYPDLPQMNNQNTIIDKTNESGTNTTGFDVLTK